MAKYGDARQLAIWFTRLQKIRNSTFSINFAAISNCMDFYNSDFILDSIDYANAPNADSEKFIGAF
jgi:hypothetical protein